MGCPRRTPWLDNVAYTFVFRILSTSLTSVFQFSLSPVTLGIYLRGSVADPDPPSLKMVNDENMAGSGSESGSISQRHGSADPDPHQNVMDLQHCSEVIIPGQSQGCDGPD
jgi:hypothetical protein